MQRILVIFGTRPEAIKLAPIISLIKSDVYNKKYELKVCVTGQHRELLDQVLEIFQIEPDYDLNLMTRQQDLSDLSARMLPKLRDVLIDYKPDKVLVHGDTTTSFIGSLVSFYENCEVVHIEAGLRTHDLSSPWPEEANRQLTARLVKRHMAPTVQARLNLLAEGIDEKKIFVTGNTVIDAMLQVKDKIFANKELREDLIGGLCLDFDISYEKYILITGHRRENIGKNLINTCEAVKRLAEEYPDIQIVFAMHLNPKFVNALQQNLKGIRNIHLIPPQDYLTFVLLIYHSYLILTDSGGIQEEAPSFGKPVLVTRNTTERPEIIECGAGILVGTEANNIYKTVKLLLEDHAAYKKMENASNPFGDGTAALQILENLNEH